MAHGPLRSMLKPACCQGAPVKVAPNSSDRPGAYRALVSAIAASTVTTPLATVTEPPLAQVLLVHSGGKVVPENSEPAAGWRIISPSVVCTTAAPASGV